MAIIKNSNLENYVLKLLEGMGKVNISKGEKICYLIKNNIIFAKIIDEQILLLTSENQDYTVISENILRNKDSFLIKATKSYFIAKKQHEELFVA